MSPFSLRTLRQRRGLSLRQLAALSGIHYSTLCNIEHGLMLREEQARTLAGTLGVEPSALRRGVRR